MKIDEVCGKVFLKEQGKLFQSLWQKAWKKQWNSLKKLWLRYFLQKRN